MGFQQYYRMKMFIGYIKILQYFSIPLHSAGKLYNNWVFLIQKFSGEISLSEKN